MLKVAADAPKPITQTLYPENTGSSILAVKYKDGVMMACDTQISTGSRNSQPATQRLSLVGKDTVIAASGDHADFQYALELLRAMELTDSVRSDGITRSPAEYHSYISRVLYERRNKMNPLWGSFVIGGMRDGERFLGMADMWGTSITENIIGTGIGAYYGLAHLRKEASPEMSEEEARKLLKKCLNIISLVDNTASQLIQFAKVTAGGATVEDPEFCEPNWDIDEIKGPRGKDNLSGYKW